MTKKGYQPITNIVKDKEGKLFTDSHSILARWRNHLSSYSIYMGLIMLGTEKYIQQSQ